MARISVVPVNTEFDASSNLFNFSCNVYGFPSLCFVSKQLEYFERLVLSFTTATLSLLWLI